MKNTVQKLYIIWHYFLEFNIELTFVIMHAVPDRSPPQKRKKPHFFHKGIVREGGGLEWPKKIVVDRLEIEASRLSNVWILRILCS